MRISDWSSDVCSSDLRCSVRIGFDEAQAHLLHAGADILLHGSRFEPFGLTPLYSMRYGTIPIGSRIGGLADTILDPGSSEERRVGKECFIPCRSRWSPYPSNTQSIIVVKSSHN